ncbi:type I restriction enzyme, S subunit [Caloramator quimbayensis]|uniref:Type I restriction enzyme, S subunit n=1 Tax=Caloramator quimbayensis TaxID=1147123 RepID=A0A1T4Y4I2_9CLOT|nr:restriction endonuclease subunit S [Caloramator quimbayensis]SKA96660.1 type I restriction enzyme, S subunit [Caloramator quimbayensis]
MSCNEWRETELGLIPADWDVKVIGEIGKVVGGGTPNTKESKYWDGNVSWITPKDLSGFYERYIYKGERSITKEGLENSSAKLMPKGTVLFSSRAPIGYVAIAGKELATNQGYKNIICNDEIAYNIFVYYLMKYKKNEIEQIANGSTFKEVSGKVLSEFKIILPPLHEQKAIAKILSDIDEKIEINNRINKVLEEIAQTIFKHYFVDFEFPNENGEPYKSSGGEMVESELGPIPKGWEVRRLGEILETSLGGTPKREKKEYWENGTIPWCNSAKANDFRIIEPTEYITEKGLKESSTKLLPRRTIVIAITGATLGKISLLEIDSCTNQSLVGILENKLYKAEFIYPLMKMQIKQLINLQTGGAQQHINKDNINKLKIILPQKELLEKYYDITEKIFKQISIRTFEVNNLSQLRDTLLPKLMSGEIRVPQNNKRKEYKNV